MSPPQEPILINESHHHHVAATAAAAAEVDEFRLPDLIKSIHDVLGDEGLDSERIDAQRIIRLMERYSSNSDDWSKYTLFDHSRAYTRNLIDDGNGKFNLMILAWSKGQKSPIHNHSGSHCVMKILDGELQETLFDWPTIQNQASDDSLELSDVTDAVITEGSASLNGQPLAVCKDSIYRPNQVTYVHDNIGLHRIANPSQHSGAVSLHLYTPPYKVCKTFEEKTGRARSSGICTFYSIGGNRIQEDSNK